MKKIIRSGRLRQIQHDMESFIFGLLLIILGGYFVIKGLNLLPFTGKIEISIQWEVFLFGCIAVLASLILFFKWVRSWLNQRKRIALAKRYHQPWYLDYSWNSKGIYDEATKNLTKLPFSVAVFAMVLIPLNWYVFIQSKALGFYAVAVILDIAFGIVFVGLIHQIIHVVKYGRTYLKFARFPFFLGNKLYVTFTPNRFSVLDCTLRCIEERVEKKNGNDKGEETNHYELYIEQKKITSSTRIKQVPIQFDLPDTQEWRTRLQGYTAIRYWELDIKSDQPGIDFSTTFLLPIYLKESNSSSS